MLDFKYQLKITPLLLLKYLPLMALVLLPLLIEFDAFAVDDTTRISISANKNNYEEGETILLTVSVSQFDYYNSLKIEIRINETLIGIDKKIISENGKYTFEFLAEGPFLDEEGIITVKAFLREATDTTQFNFKPRPVEESKQIIEKSTNNLPKVVPEPKPTEGTSVSKGTIQLSPSKVDSELAELKVEVAPSVSKGTISPSSSKVDSVVPKHTSVTSSQDKSPPNILGILIVIVLFVILFLIVRKFKKPTKNYNYEEEKNRKESEWNKKRSEDHHRRQEEERQRWEREKYNRQDNKQEKKQKQQKKQKEEKQYTESNKTEFSVTESLEILNVHHDATAAVIKKAQREMVLKYHPDKHKSTIQRKHAEIMMKNINIAFETLQSANRV